MELQRKVRRASVSRACQIRASLLSQLDNVQGLRGALRNSSGNNCQLSTVWTPVAFRGATGSVRFDIFREGAVRDCVYVFAKTPGFAVQTYCGGPQAKSSGRATRWPAVRHTARALD